MRFSYGVRLEAGENVLSGKLPYGLRCSLRRRRRVGQLDYSDADMKAAEKYVGELRCVQVEATKPEPATEPTPDEPTVPKPEPVKKTQTNKRKRR